MAEWTGLEPATSGVTGQHSNRLNYHSALKQPGMPYNSTALNLWKNKGARKRPWLQLAEWTGLEPATSGVTGQHSNRLNYHSAS
jgi:hypothetical protein